MQQASQERELQGWEMVGVGAPLRPASRAPTLAEHEALIEVVGCGICHTDLSFLDQGVRTRHPVPLILGHEIAGYVREAGPAHRGLIGRAVVVPAVIPCGACVDCLGGRPMICKRQVMPGNDRDGGFASHVVVPAHGLCVVPGAGPDPDAPLSAEAPGLTLRHLAVIADAVATPYQAVVRSGLRRGDLAIIVGLGGVGGYAAQIARAQGAHVVSLDVDPHTLATAAALGVGLAINVAQEDPKQVRKIISAYARKVGAPETGWCIFECSGTAAGQRSAWSLLVHGATLMIVGFTLDSLELRLSNLMAFDARALGNWGCDPALYPDIVAMALAGHIDLRTHTELRPLDDIAVAFDDVRHHRVGRRLVLTP